MTIEGYRQPPFLFGGPGASPKVARSDILKASLVAKGALLLGGGSNTVGALAVGVNTQALIADSTQALGVKWAGETAWTAPSLNANWSSYGSGPVGYRRDALGFVHLRGQLINASGAANPAFTLPAGYRPIQDAYFATGAVTAGVVGTPHPIQIQIVGSTGAVASNGNSVNDYTDLDGITFLAEQ